MVNSSQPAVTDVIRTLDDLLIDMSQRDFGHPELPDLADELRQTIYRQCKENNPLLVCRTHRHPMALRIDGGRLSARHIIGAHEKINHGKSPEHEACQERILTMARQRGLDAWEESSVGSDGKPHLGRVNDVVIRGDHTIGYEAAYTDTATAVTRKLHRGLRDGVTVYFGGPADGIAARNFVNRAPYGVYNHLPAVEIIRGRPMPIIGGASKLRRWECDRYQDRCPLFGTRRKCHQKYHSDFRDPQRVDQDDLLYYLAIGLWAPVQLKNRKTGTTWSIVPAESVAIFLDDGGTILNIPDATDTGTSTGSARSAAGLVQENVECQAAYPSTRSPYQLTSTRTPRTTGTSESEQAVFEFDGQAWLIPDDLLRIQRDWDTADKACAQASLGDDRGLLTDVRRRRLDLTMALHRHLWFTDHPPPSGRRNAADQALKRAARGVST